jgi:hypothetical protein
VFSFYLQEKEFNMSTKKIKVLVIWVDGSVSYQSVVADRSILEIEDLLEGSADSLRINKEATLYYNEMGAFKNVPVNELATEVAHELGCDLCAGETLHGKVIITGGNDPWGNDREAPSALAEDIMRLAELRTV